jgi:hypothetical protein
LQIDGGAIEEDVDGDGGEGERNAASEEGAGGKRGMSIH